jgi:hypothetical protein
MQGPHNVTVGWCGSIDRDTNEPRVVSLLVENCYYVRRFFLNQTHAAAGTKIKCMFVREKMTEQFPTVGKSGP